MDEFEELFGEKKPEKKVAGPEGHRARVRDAMERNPELSGFSTTTSFSNICCLSQIRERTPNRSRKS